MFTFIAITSLFGAAFAAPSGGLGEYAVDEYTVPHYKFNYAVNDPATGDNKAQTEVRNGDVVKGSYSVAEPDGTIRIVEYSADPARGFNAIVKRVSKPGSVHPQAILAPVISKQIVAPVIEPIAPIAEPILKDVGYSADLLGLGGWGNNLGLGLGGAWNLGGLGGWKH